MNYIDAIIVLILIYHIIRGYQLGFFNLLIRLISFVGSIIGAFMVYRLLGDVISNHFNTLPTFSYGFGFIIAFILIQIILSFILNTLFSSIPEKIRENKATKILGIIPGAIDGIIFVALVTLILLISPTPPSLRSDIGNSKIGGYFEGNYNNFQNFLDKISGGAIERSLSLITTESKENETIELPYKPSNLKVDPKAEQKMLELINEERAKVGIPPLVMDETIVTVARAHSYDMWQRKYFSHVDPDGKDPFDRMKEGGVKFISAGENIALAPNVEVAHKGLMNSPGHKRNILDPSFHKVGIGVIDGRIYGQMYTQDFTN